ncbi:MAG: hypothetical protein FJW99_05405 [Actinobacteria bacterium]|nr:hypothetical protein [Actinomycetota bacterium]MBM3698210.1 hypothetical protein [Actinomycetota bacterium]
MDDDPLDLAEAAAFIMGERPGLQEDDVWTVLKELGDPPVRNADGMAVDLITRLHPGMRPRDVRTILGEWREYARLAVEEDWD